MNRNDLHEYTDNATVRIINDTVMVSQDNRLIATDVFISDYLNSNSRTRQVADFYYKKHILNTYDDANQISTPYKAYYTEYSPEPGVMLRVLTSDFGIRGLRKIVAVQGTAKALWAKKGQRVDAVIKKAYSL